MEGNPLRTIYDAAIVKAVRAKSLNAILEVNPFDPNIVPGPLNQYTYFAKDNFAIAGSITTGGSNFLFDFRPGYTSSVIERVRNAGAIYLGKANMDEFGLGGTGTYSAKGPTLNPHDETRIAGGSSSGSAALVGARVCDFALGSDTGDSIRRPASYCGVIGFKPSYGLVSRYGVYPYSPSLDHVGLFANDLLTVARVMDAIAGFDYRDATTYRSKPNFTAGLTEKRGKLVVIEEIEKGLSAQVRPAYDKAVADLKKAGFEIVRASFRQDLLEAMMPTYCIISFSEAASCYANLTGLSFGSTREGAFDEAITQARGEEFGKQFKRRLLIGAYCMSRENFEPVFQRSKLVRAAIVAECDRVMELGDALLLPAANDIAPKLENVVDTNFISDEADVVSHCLLLGNFGGYPSITLPCSKVEGMPWGVNITTKHDKDQDCLNIAGAVMEAFRE